VTVLSQKEFAGKVFTIPAKMICFNYTSPQHRLWSIERAALQSNRGIIPCKEKFS